MPRVVIGIEKGNTIGTQKGNAAGDSGERDDTRVSFAYGRKGCSRWTTLPRFGVPGGMA